jgi:hypothetical protein
MSSELVTPWGRCPVLPFGAFPLFQMDPLAVGFTFPMVAKWTSIIVK